MRLGASRQLLQCNIMAACRLVDRFHETNRIARMELKPTDLILRRRTDLGFTRDRHIKYASRLRPTCGAPSRRMAAGSVSLVARPSRRAQSFEARAPSFEARAQVRAHLRMTGARAPQDEVRAPQ